MKARTLKSTKVNVLTLGCSQNTCAFCGMYKTKSFKIRPVAEIRAEIDMITNSRFSGKIRIIFANISTRNLTFTRVRC